MSLVVGKEVVDWIASKTGEFNNFGTDIGIGWQKNDVLVAGVAYANWNGPNIEAHIASDGSKRWLTKEFLWVMFDYPFNQVKAKRITACTGEGNLDARRFIEHLGFTLEAKLADAHPTGGLCIYKMFRKECRFIGERYEGIHKERMAVAA